MGVWGQLPTGNLGTIIGIKYMKNKRKITKIGKGKECPKCKHLMERRKHTEIGEKENKKAYYFTEWDYCWSCKHIQFYEEFKVWNNNEKSKWLKNQKELEEIGYRFTSI